MNSPSAPPPAPEPPKEPDRMEIEAAAEKAKKRSTGSKGAKIGSLLSGGYAGFKDKDTLG